jgi:phospholipid transport system substrate-binding protein
MKTLRCVLLALVAVSGSLCARADEPTAQMRATTDKILALLADPDLKTDARSLERRQLIRKELDQRIDWATVARGCLGRHWAKRTRSEQTEFVNLFRRLVEETSLDKLEANSSKLEKIEYLQITHPVEYRLQKSGKDWRVYDVLIEGVSLVKNYRDQFDEILAKSSYEKLMADLRAKAPQSST